MAGTSVSVKRMWSLFTTNTATVKDALRTLFEEHNKTIIDLETLRGGMTTLVGSATWASSSIADRDEEAKDVTVAGAALGDFVLVSASVDVEDLVLSAEVVSANTVTCILMNNTSGAIDIGSFTVTVTVIAAGTRATVDAASDLTASKLTTPESGD